MTESLSDHPSPDGGITPRQRFIENSLRQKIFYDYIITHGGDHTGADDPHAFAMMLAVQRGVTSETVDLLEALAAVRARPNEGIEL